MKSLNQQVQIQLNSTAYFYQLRHHHFQFSGITGPIALTSSFQEQWGSATGASVPSEIQAFLSADVSGWLSSLGIAPEKLVLARQVHSAAVRYVDAPGVYSNLDGFFTDKPNLHLAIRTADCAAVMILLPEVPAIGIAHAGWRGARDGIVENLAESMGKRWSASPRNMVVFLSPFIRSCCYEVGQEFADYFPEAFLTPSNGRYHFDLEKYIRHTLMRLGVPEKQIFDTGECTHCSPLRLPSYRRDKNSGRLFNIITMKGGVR